MARSKNKELTVIQSKAIALMVAGYSSRDVAIKLNLNQDTISLWQRQEIFVEQKKKALDTIFNAAMAELIDGAQEAVRELRLIIQDPDTPQRIKIQAISVLLNSVSKNRSNTPLLEDINTNTEDKTKKAIDILISTAESKEELKEAIQLQQKQWLLEYQLSQKLTIEESKAQIEKLINVIFNVVNEEQKEIIARNLEELLQKLKEPA